MKGCIAKIILVCAGLHVGPVLAAETFSRGVGIYPGDPAEDFSPSLVAAPAGRRNLALHRAATQSSAYDYNLTAQLVTDGITQSELPGWISVSTSTDGELPKHQRELVLDDNVVSGVEFDGPGWIELHLGGGGETPVVDRVELGLVRRNWMPFGPPVVSPACIASPWLPRREEPDADEDVEWGLAISDDGREWLEVGTGSAAVPPVAPAPSFDSGIGRIFNWMVEANPPLWSSVRLHAPMRSRRYRVELANLECKQWSVAEVRFYSGDERVRVGGPHRFGSAWRSAGLGEEWVAVDLGARARIEGVVLHWLLPPGMGEVQVSDDGATWRRVASITGKQGVEEIGLSPVTEARHLRLLMRRPTSEHGYVLSELEVVGEGGLIAEPHSQAAGAGGRGLHLAGGNWRLQRASLVMGDPVAVSEVGFQDDDWVVATVPGTVLTSYHNVGALPDLSFGDHELAISDSFFHSDFWYRNEFQGPRLTAAQRAFLEFDGVNWKAEVFLNGSSLGRVEGAFQRGRFDVTDHIRPGAPNALAIRIERPASPGSAKQHTLEHAGHNGGAIGADSPSYHASIGWDWMPTIRGRNIGLWNDVYLTVAGPVTLDDPYLDFTLPLPDTSSADVRLEVGLTNHSGTPVGGTLRGTFGEVAFEQAVNLPAASSRTLVLDPSTHPRLRLRAPRLWWPNGHGEPHLYDVELRFETANRISDRKSWRSGVRQITYSPREEPLQIFVNGRRVVPRGGNWGFSEAHLRYRGREYDTAMRYHRDMNFTMVRNWVGQTADEEFYAAADRHGILVWQDFWLANPLDGPDPQDEDLFMSNVRDTLRRIRNHPSVGLYCGRNEGHPPATLDARLEAAVAELHPGLRYIPNSIFGSVSGGGPYGVRPREYYFEERSTPKLHSELGMTSVVTLESLREMIPEAELWPPGLFWGLHDFNLESNQRAEDFVAVIDQAFGGSDDLESWVEIAQLVNYDGYRAMFEAQSQHRSGLLLWMSHPAWPSLTWQTYDYYFNPHASYFGAKKGSEPLHIQWNPLTDEVEVVNYGVPDGDGLIAEAQVLNLDGSVAWESRSRIDSPHDSTVSPFPVEFPPRPTAVHFIRLRLLRGDEAISENFYWRGAEPGNYRALRTLPRIRLQVTTEIERRADEYVLYSVIENPSTTPALGVRLVVFGADTGRRILPVLLAENFVALMPSESRALEARIQVRDALGERPRIAVEGFNVLRQAD